MRDVKHSAVRAGADGMRFKHRKRQAELGHCQVYSWRLEVRGFFGSIDRNRIMFSLHQRDTSKSVSPELVLSTPTFSPSFLDPVSPHQVFRRRISARNSRVSKKKSVRQGPNLTQSIFCILFTVIWARCSPPTG